MPINNAAARAKNYIINPSMTRKFVTHLNKAGVLLPVILLESTVTGGRTYQAYKRGGYTEARERLCEETTGAIFWLGGVKWFNALGNWIGKKYMGIKDPKFSLATDAVRHPFDNMVREEKLDAVKKKLISFKFTKVAAAVVAAGGFLGFVVPKINQSVTRKLLKSKKNKDNTNVNNKLNTNPALNETMEAFTARMKASKPSFKGLSLNTFATITNNLENHDIYKLLATDTGVLAGRTYNARNKDERIEIFVRDAGSIYFYLKCKDHIIQLLQKLDGHGGKLSKLDPQTAARVHNVIIEQLMRHEQKNGDKFSIETLRKSVLGSAPEKVEENLSKIKFKKGDIIALEEFEKLAKEAGINVDNAMLKKAERMATLQPERMLSDIGINKVGGLLTKQQVRDVLSDSIVSRATFIKKVMKYTFNGDLTDPYKFVANKDVETLRANIDSYVHAILEYAEKSGAKELTPDLLLKVNKNNLFRNALHIGSGLGVSALFLSTVIPKLQYWITKVRTGKDAFPGVQDIK